MAEKLILANDSLDSEVLFDVEVLEVDRTTNQTYGLTYPKQIAGAIVPPGFTGLIAANNGMVYTALSLILIVVARQQHASASTIGIMFAIASIGVS